MFNFTFPSVLYIVELVFGLILFMAILTEGYKNSASKTLKAL